MAEELDEKSALEQLKALVEEREPHVNVWRSALPALRAQASASAAVLGDLAKFEPGDQPGSAPRGESVDVLISAPDMEWGAYVLLRLREALPDWPAGEFRTWSADTFQPGVPPQAVVLRVPVHVPGRDGQTALQRVRAALTAMNDVSVDYSEPLDLLVVTPTLPYVA